MSNLRPLVLDMIEDLHVLMGTFVIENFSASPYYAAYAKTYFTHAGRLVAKYKSLSSAGQLLLVEELFETGLLDAFFALSDCCKEPAREPSRNPRVASGVPSSAQRLGVAFLARSSSMLGTGHGVVSAPLGISLPTPESPDDPASRKPCIRWVSVSKSSTHSGQRNNACLAVERGIAGARTAWVAVAALRLDQSLETSRLSRLLQEPAVNQWGLAAAS